MNSKRFFLVVLVCLCCVANAAAQTPAPTPPATPPPTNGNSLGFDISGHIDGYYSLNFNHPASRNNNLRNFDVKANQFSLNMAEIVLERAAEPVGFRIDFGFGKAYDIVHGTEPSADAFRYIQQAYVTFKPAGAKGLQVDFGKFVTSAGAEVIETHSNWNYSRSLLFAWAIPYYHFGARVSHPIHKNFTAGVQLVNGWNSVEDTNTGKTVGLTGTFTTSKFSWTHNYYVGPEKLDTNQGVRHLYDTTLLLTPSDKANLYINFDYGVDRNIGGGSNHWVGIASALRMAPTSWFALIPRIEWFNDADGFATGTAQKLKEFTLTGEFRMKEGLIMRTEYRRDWSDQPFFDRGNSAGSHKNQDTVLVGFVAFFGPKR